MSFSFHAAAIIIYFINKSKTSFIIYLGTLVVNLSTMIMLLLYMFKNPGFFHQLNLMLYAWIFSGFTSGMLLFIKIKIFLKFMKRRRDKNMYHLNFFGKRIYHGELFTKIEFNTLIISAPIFVITGAFFMVILMRMKTLNLTF
jgi:hypothetical protein